MRVLVCGGRDFTGYRSLRKTLEGILEDAWFVDEESEVTFISGGASGADFLCKVFVLDEYGEVSGVHYEEYPANWKKYGRSAGPIRNQQMVDEGNPDLVVAFPGDDGTADMICKAKRAGVRVVKVK